MPRLTPPTFVTRLPAWLLAMLAFLGAGLLSVLVAWAAAVLIENRSVLAVNARYAEQQIEGFTVASDGLRVILTGTAQSEAARFRAVNQAGRVVDSGRIVDEIQVAPSKVIEAPRYSVEMLRNDDGIQLIGLLPDDESETTLTTAAAALGQAGVSAMLETASFDPPTVWQPAFDFGLAALKMLPRSKISVAADGVTVTAIAASETEKRQFEAELAAITPKAPPVSITISAPRPVLTPFTLRFVIDTTGAHFDSCSADTERARDRILAAAYAAGMDGAANCVIGLGVPTPRWAEAAEAGIKALATLGGGTLTFADADVTLLAADSTDQATFDRVLGELQTALPPVFSLDATLPKKPDAPIAGPAEFTAVLAPSGRVELRGRLVDETERAIVEAFAKAQFGVKNVYVATRLDPDLPDGWPVRVLAGLEALGQVEHGSLLVRADTVEVTGVTGSQQARARISQILSGKLGQGQTFKVAATYDKALDPQAALPTPAQCLADVQQLLKFKKISFTPGSAEIEASAVGLVSSIADVLAQCPPMELEIAGHTDAQGSEDGNRALSQARAEAVVVALQGRRVDVSKMRAVGYGETYPIAENETDLGREANRRIEFTPFGAAAKPAPVADAPAKGDGTVIAAKPLPENAQACVKNAQDVLAKQKIAFDPGSARIDSAADGVMAALATVLKQCPGLPVEISGHTDSQGTERNNKTLSQQRAEAVVAALKEAGVDTGQMSAMGYGEEKPIAENSDEEGRETNRRIEIALTGAGAAPAALPRLPDGSPDFTADSSPSVAPAENSLRPKARPANNE
jgi:OmpA-OmpF porin, OOP family